MWAHSRALKNIICKHTEFWDGEGKQYVNWGGSHFALQIVWMGLFAHMVNMSQYIQPTRLPFWRKQGKLRCFCGVLMLFVYVCLSVSFCLPELNYGGCVTHFRCYFMCYFSNDMLPEFTNYPKRSSCVCRLWFLLWFGSSSSLNQHGYILVEKQVAASTRRNISFCSDRNKDFCKL